MIIGKMAGNADNKWFLTVSQSINPKQRLPLNGQLI